MPLDGQPKPNPKAQTLARGQRRYRRKVASPKQWQAIIAAKVGPCRACVAVAGNGHDTQSVQFHHIVTRSDGGDDVPDNIIPLHGRCHTGIHNRLTALAESVLASLSDAEYAYMIQRGGEDYPERAYGVRYSR